MDGTVERVGGYRVVRRLATGGTSDVLLAKAEGPHGFERTVVLKLLLSQYRNDEDFAKMFAREAAAYARLSHPSIVQLFDFFQLDGQLVMVLEYVDGAPLSRLRGMLKAVGQTIDDKAALYIAQRIFSALAAAHESTGEGGTPTPVIHRDVNPTNVLVPWDGHVKLADFGIAKVTGVTHESAAGVIKGTYGYMAPEQVEGGMITTRADVYAAGIILWELLTRRRAFQRGALPEIEVLRAMAEPRITSIDVLRPDVDLAVREAINRALVPKADKRNITAEEMVAILKDAVGPEEGRERLASLLSLVRHEPKPMPTSLPPPQTDPMPAAPKPPPLKPPRLPPRPASVPKMPAAAAAGPPTTKRTVSGPLPAVTPPPKLSTKTAQGIAPPKEAEPSGPQLVEEQLRESERMRLATPLQAIAPGMTLKDAIDEILTSVPSSIPPSVLSSARVPVQAEPKPVYPPSSVPPPGGPDTTRMIQVPPPPKAILDMTLPLGERLPPGATDGTVPPQPPLVSEPPQIGLAIADALRNPPQPFDQATRENDRPEQPLDRTLALSNDPQANVTTSKVPVYDGPTNPTPPAPPQMAPPPAPEPLPPMPAQYAPPSGSSNPVATNGSHEAMPARTKPSSVGVIAFMIVITIAAGVAGTVFYVRHQKGKELASSRPHPVAPPTTATVAAPFVPPSVSPSATASASASASASAVASASASTSPIASASASASAPSPPASAAPVASAAPSATASAAASAPVATGAIPEGMGVLHTTGAAPNRRIFVDEKVVGQTPESVTVKCGSRSVKLGSAGKPQTLDIPCGGEITASDR